MGLGGYLCWTALAREIRNKYGVKTIPLEMHGSVTKLIKSPVFKNNPNVLQDFVGEPAVQIILNHPASNYCIQDTPQKAFHKTDQHIIETICKPYGMDNPKIKCDIFLEEQEESVIDDLLSGVPDKFVTIEPFSKTNYTPNRAYPVEKWQKIVNEIHEKITVVQVGNTGHVLENVIDFTGKTTFRQAAGIIGRSSLFLATESGLVHAASAFNVKSIVIITGYQTEKMVAYPMNININISSHGPCGLKVNCSECIKDAADHDETEITSAALEYLCL